MMSKTDKKIADGKRGRYGVAVPDKGFRIPLRASAMLLSRREVTVCGCRRIAEYSSTRIKISVCEGSVTVEGRGLSICTYRGDELTVRGWLSGIFFEDMPIGEGDCGR